MAVLYDYWRSTASYRVRIALGLAGINWTACGVNLLEGAHKSQAHLARNPQGLVPVLEIDGITLTQSLAQIEYLDETRGLGLLPTAPAHRAQVRAMAYVIAMETHPVCNLGVAKFATQQSDGTIETRDWMRHFIPQGLAAYEAMITGDVYSFGNGISLADLCLIPQVYNADRWGVDLSKFPQICRVRSALTDHPAFVAAHPDRFAPA